MNAYEPLTDTELEAMLARLTEQGRADGLEAAIMAAVDATPQQRRPWARWPDWRPTRAPELRLVWYLAVLGLLLALLAGTLAVGSRLLEPRPPLPARLDAPLEGMVTEEVEPGVLRVVNDGVRDLASVDNRDIVAGYDGGIWLLREQGFLRLGSDRIHRWPAQVGPENHVFEVAPDGTSWVIPGDPLFRLAWEGEGLRTTDGETWSGQPCPGDYCKGVTVAPDGTVWASWYDGVACDRGMDEDCSWWVGYLGPTGWQRLDGSTPADFSPPGFDRLFVTRTGDVYAVTCIWVCAFYRYAGGAWQPERDAYRLVDVGPDGTVWQDGGLLDEVTTRFPGDGLARFADGEWTRWTSADLPEIKYGLGLDLQFKVAPDRSLWFSLWRSADGGDPRVGDYWRWEERSAAVEDGRLVCDGLARFDGQRLHQFLEGRCLSMDIAADGSVWVLADDEEGHDVYVITPGAVAATTWQPAVPGRGNP